jgi:hypothetical protein
MSLAFHDIMQCLGSPQKADRSPYQIGNLESLNPARNNFLTFTILACMELAPEHLREVQTGRTRKGKRITLLST